MARTALIRSAHRHAHAVAWVALVAALAMLALAGVRATRARRREGLIANARAVTVRKEVFVAAPLEQVRAHWAGGRFHEWMSHVRDVRTLAEGSDLWILEGPAGMPVEWISRRVADSGDRIAWVSDDPRMGDAEGEVAFAAEDAGTRVTLTVRYVPFGGLVGHAVARAFGDAEGSHLDADLLRFKAMLESGSHGRNVH